MDVHLGTLAKLLRMLGFDATYKTDLTDATIARIAQTENRIVLTRDVGLLKHKTIAQGHWLRSQQTEEQLREVLQKYKIKPSDFKPLSRCLVCNTWVQPAAKEQVSDKLPPKTQLYFNEFYQCPTCGKVYWKGSHYEHMMQVIQRFYV